MTLTSSLKELLIIFRSTELSRIRSVSFLADIPMMLLFGLRRGLVIGPLIEMRPVELANR